MAQPSLLIPPQRFSTGKLFAYSPQQSTPVELSVTRGTTATRTNVSGLIESVASGIARLDYRYAGALQSCPALLVEPAATNGILNSQDSSTNWLTGANLTSYLSVIQGINGRELEVTTAGSNIGVAAGRYRIGSLSFNLVSGSIYTISFIVKRTSTHSIFGYYALATNDLGGGFDVSNLNTGVIYSNADFGSRVRRITPLGNDEFLCEETFTMTASRTLTAFHVAPVAGVTNSANASLNSRIAFAAPQIELGAVATSRILTGNTIQTRNADVISLTGASGYIGQTQGGVAGRLAIGQTSLTRTVMVLSDGTVNNRIHVYVDSSNRLNADIVQGGITAASMQSAVLASGTHAYCLSYEQAVNAFLYVNGGFADSDSPPIVPACNQFLFGSYIGGIEYYNGHLGVQALFKEALTTAELIDFSTL